jgi:hypothetical protein
MTEVLLIGGAILTYILLGKKNNKNKVNNPVDTTDNPVDTTDSLTENRLQPSVDRHYSSGESDANSNGKGHTKR